VGRADELLEFFDHRMAGITHSGISEVGNGLAVQLASFAERIEGRACQRQPARPIQKRLKLDPGRLPSADKLMSDHRIPLSQRIISIRTPENIELSYALAGPGSRAAAYFVDLLLMSAVAQLMINAIAYGLALLLRILGANSELWVAAIATILSFAFYNGYFIIFEWLWNGQTPGKRLLHIRVIKHGGYSLRFFDMLLRNLLRAIDFLPLFYGVGLISLLLTRDSQRLGDLAAGTLVVYQEPIDTGSLLPDLAAPDELEQPLPAEQLAALPAPVISLAVEYLRSRNELAPRPRQELAGELVNLVRETSGLNPRPAQSAEGFLACVVRQAEPAPRLSSPIPAAAELPS
jgi:uncharacterized RDD family membrane protein YckC